LIPKFFDEDESFVFQSVVFDSESKKLIIEKRDVKNKKGKSRSEVDLANMRSSQISGLHRETKMLLMIPLESLRPRMPD
jgi:hypothetical protein